MERTRTNVSRLGAALVAGLVVGLTIVGTTPANAVPAHKILFGAHVSPRWGLRQQDAIHRFEGMLGRKLAIVNRYQNLSESSMGFATHMSAEGRLPMISWRAVDHKEIDPNRAAKIARGDFDPQIRAFADAVKAVKRPVLVRFAWEMTQGPGQVQFIGGPADFVKAWRHVVSIFRARGATNAKFVWAPRSRSFCKGRGDPYYPGDAWVSWIGGSAVPINTWTSFDELFSCFYTWAAQHPRPMMVWVGIREEPGAAAWKANFFKNAVTTIVNDMPKMRAVVYFNAISSHSDYWGDSSSRAFSAYKAMGCNTWFGGRFTCA